MKTVIGDAANALTLAHQALEALEIEATDEPGPVVELEGGDGEPKAYSRKADFSLSIALSLASIAESQAIMAGVMIGLAGAQVRIVKLNGNGKGPRLN